MPRELLAVDLNGLSQYAHFDADGNLEALEITDDVEGILEANNADRTDNPGGYGESREWKHVARIPEALCYKWEREMGMPFGFLQTREGFDVLLKKIKDPDFGKLRTDK